MRFILEIDCDQLENREVGDQPLLDEIAVALRDVAWELDCGSPCGGVLSEKAKLVGSFTCQLERNAVCRTSTV